VDRLAKRPMMIGCDVARMITIGSLPVAYAFGALTLAQLYVAALVAGLASVFFDVAGQSYVPYLVGTEQLVEANGKGTATQSVAQVAGPGLGGALFGLLKAGAMTADALSFGVSWLTLLSIQAKEARPGPSTAEVGGTATRPRLRAELLAGLGFVARHPVLRKIAACNGSASLFGQMAFALDIVFLVRVLHVPAGYTGSLIAAAGVGGVLGGMSSGALGRRIGTARLIWVSPLCFGAVSMLMPLAGQGWRLAMFPLAMFGFGFSAALYNVSQVSYRQSICPPELLGRMNAAMRWISWGPLPLAGVVGGALGTAIGVRPTLWIGLAGLWAAGFWVLASPLRTMRDVSGQADSAPVAQGADLPETA
jgi:MFS family permease